MMRRGSCAHARIHSFHASRDDSCIHAFATRARGVCPYIHRRERARLVRRIFSRRTRASIGRTRRRARREVVESTPRVISFIHSFIHSNECMPSNEELRYRRHISTRCVDANAEKRREKTSDDGFARVCVRRRRIARAGTMDDAMIAIGTPWSIHLPEETTSRRARRRRRLSRRTRDRFARRVSISSSPRARSRGRRRAR